MTVETWRPLGPHTKISTSQVHVHMLTGYTVFARSVAAATNVFNLPRREATIQERLLFESGYYSRAATIRERLLFESGYYSRAATIQERRLFI